MTEEANIPRTQRGRHAPLAIVIASLIGSALGLLSAMEFRAQGKREYAVVRDAIARFSEARGVLPRDAVVGFVSDVPPGFSGDAGTANFLSAQAGVAPTVLDGSPAHDVVLGVFIDPATDPLDYANDGLAIETNFENGVVIYARQALLTE